MGTKTTTGGKSDKTSKKASAERRLDVAKATIQELRTTVKRLEKAVAKLEGRAADLAEKAASAKKARKAAVSRAEKAEKTARRSSKSSKKSPAVVEPEAVVETEIEPTVETGPATDVPDETWNVVRLRAAARAQGVTGASRMRKDDLLAALLR